MAQTGFSYFTLPHFPGAENAATEPFSARHLPEPIRVRRGVPIGLDFPPTTEVALSSKSGPRFTDFLYTTSRLLLATERVCDLLKAEGVTREQAEYLPFVLKDKKGKVRPEKYLLINPLLKVACFDFDRAEYSLFTGEAVSTPGVKEISSIHKIQVREEQIPTDAKLFRLAEEPDVKLIRSDLLDALKAQGMDGGLVALPLGEFMT
ncbi:hypothetical protein [Corallococcus terminator]|uniref:Uncharacterized protein n=1 Tax=Corallococcus terminator TaxID=2316733 RepID=A0A3A8J5J6_9BACT|nr:hypothetical protein [Corallococcus terminator]RKG85801.1 hypothetical protein D7V88_19180 [Corallococcus terminator]